MFNFAANSYHISLIKGGRIILQGFWAFFLMLVRHRNQMIAYLNHFVSGQAAAQAPSGLGWAGFVPTTQMTMAGALVWDSNSVRSRSGH
jgi:hypothetical protein